MSSVLSASITEKEIDVSVLRRTLTIPSEAGGFATFEGIVRNHNLGKAVSYIEYECYDALAIKELRKIAAEATEKFSARLIHITHRSGSLKIGDVAVYIAAACDHRAEAFSACRYAIDELKVRVPIWKKEYYIDGRTSWPRCSHHHDHGMGT